MGTQWTVRTICGSMRYFPAMLAIADSETLKGTIVLMPFVKHIPPELQEGNPVKEMLDEMHFAKIDMSDEIIVVGSHIGKSTQREIDYARQTGKEIVHYTSVDHLLNVPADAHHTGRYIVQKAPGIPGPPIPYDEPCLVVRGQDAFAVPVMRDYIDRVEDCVGPKVIDDLYDHLGRLKDWQNANRDKVKLPDR